MHRNYFLTTLFVISVFTVKAQDDESNTNDSVYTHSYKKAMILSAVLPGTGQIYNEFGYRKIPQKKHRAWWKAPIIYGALGVTGYYFFDHLQTAKSLKTEWLYRKDNATGLYVEYVDWSDNELLSGKNVNYIGPDGSFYTKTIPGFDLASKRRDMLAFGIAVIWGLNVIEALVDAHFVTFDVSEDLSFSWSPTVINTSTPGLSFTLQF